MNAEEKLPVAEQIGDLNDLDAAIGARENGVPFAVVYPEWDPRAGQEIGLRIWVAWAESERARMVVLERQSEQINKTILAMAGRLDENEGKKTGEQLRKEELKTIVELTTKWEFYNGLKLGGETPPFSKEAAYALYLKYAFIAKQVDKKAADKDFFTAS